jgi:hypothetical protein
MRKHAAIRRVPPAPTEEDFFIRLTRDALMGLIRDLRRRVEQTGTPREAAQVLLAEAHISEAVGLLKRIQPTPSVCESHELRPHRHAGTRVQQAGRPRLHVVFRPAKQ